MSAKLHLANELASRISDNQFIGVGTGTTVEAVLGAIKERIKKEGLTIRFVPTSYQSAWRLEELGLPVFSSSVSEKLDWAFDGADEVDPNLRLLKGRGAALLHEKLIASRTDRLFIAVDDSKLVSRLGERMAVPVEVIPESRFSVKQALFDVGAKEVELRLCSSLERTMTLFTQEGNLILDARFDEIGENLEAQINSIPGVVENGIFSSHATEVLVGKEARVEVLKR